MNLDALLQEKKILVCCGAGGVGKTTTAAAIAIRAAMLGQRTLVLTIDPARRLANALGVSEFGNEVRAVPRRKFEKAGVPLKGELRAMMVDTKRTFDDLVERFALNVEMRDAILGNPIYQQLSETLSGSREYMAMEKLFDLHSTEDADLIVLDTPPTRHALDFLEAPDRITAFLEGKVIHWLVKPYLMAGQLGFKVFRKGTSSVFGVLEKVTGMEFLKDISDFILSFEGMYDGFNQRAKRVKALLADRDTGFLLVTSPNRRLLDETVFFYNKLVEHKMHVDAVIVNKVHRPLAGSAAGPGGPLLSDQGRQEAAARMAEAAGFDGFRSTASKLLLNLARHQAMAERDSRNIETLAGSLDRGVGLLSVPLFPLDVHDFDGLSLLNQHLFAA
ncbi:MAG: ArsA-related P-loop ATPase [Deltaproteobacteria bacterium]|nr:ArsA-related P-loop ATPase [Deltaproteobacteria bacterium]